MLQIIKKEEDIQKMLNKFAKRNAGLFSKDKEKKVVKILEEVKKRGDKALFSFTSRFDHVKIDAKTIKVKEEEISNSYHKVDKEFLTALSVAKNNIEGYQRKLLSLTEKVQEKKIPVNIKNCWLWEMQKGIIVGQKQEPIESVGVYIPGGTANYPSTVLHTCVAAQVAGVKRIAIVTPPKKDDAISPFTLVAAHQVGVKEIYKVGGVQAIAALAYGTESIPKVDKIVGPGNVLVTLAKKFVFGEVGIDMLAGPTEIVILADRSAKPGYIAADILSQAEHDPEALIILIATSDSIARRTNNALKQLIRKLPRKQIAEKAILKNGFIFITKSLEDAVKWINVIAPEHLAVQVKPYFAVLDAVKNAGAIFLGNYAPVSAGDYLTGPSHVLPTGATAKFSSPLSVFDFFKRSSVMFYTREELLSLTDHINKFAQVEGLEGHGLSLKERL